ncbi:S24 family peptidase [Kushneria sp. AK178]
MANTIDGEDVILVDRSRTKPDGVFLVQVGGALRGKRVQRMIGSALSLVSDNRKYEP